MGSGVPRLAIVPDLLYVTCPIVPTRDYECPYRESRCMQRCVQRAPTIPPKQIIALPVHACRGRLGAGALPTYVTLLSIGHHHPSEPYPAVGEECHV